MTLLLASLLALGVWFVWRGLVMHRIDEEERRSLGRLQAILEQEREQDKVIVDEHDGTTGLRRMLLRLVNRISAKLERSRHLDDEEGADLLLFIQRELAIAGLYPRFTPHQALAVLLLCWAGEVGIGMMGMLGILSPWIAILGGIVFLAFPPLKVVQMKNTRKEKIRSEVVFFLQELTMALATGALNIDTAIARVAEDSGMIGTRSIVADEFRRAVREYQIGGLRREDALRGVAERCDVQEVSNLVDAILGGMEMGTEGLVQTLEAYGDQAREQYSAAMREFIKKQEPKMSVALVITMFGGLILYAGPMILTAVNSVSLG